MATLTDHVYAAEHDFRFYRGDKPAPDVLEFFEGDTQLTPLDLRGATLLLHITTVDPLPQLVVALEMNTHLAVGGVSGNEVTITWPALPAGVYFYDLEVQFPDNRRITYLYGRIEVQKDRSK